MPKGKKKGKYEHKRTEQADSSDEDAGIDMTIDNCSEISGQSDLKSQHDEAENELQEKLEDKVLEAIEALNARSNAARAAALVGLKSILQRRCMGHILVNHKATMADHITKMLRRGKDGEKKAAAMIAPILALQIGDDDSEEFLNEVRPALLATVVDKSASFESRTEACTSLTVLCYLLEEDLSEILEIMRTFETVFSGSYLKGDGTVKLAPPPPEGQLHSACVDGWALLLVALPPHHAAALLDRQAPGFGKLTEMLQAATVEVRISAGVAMAIAYEHITSEDEDPSLFAEVELALPKLDELTKESHKYKSKKDRKLQRATFRDVLKYFEDDSPPQVSVSLPSGPLSLSSWQSRTAYVSLAASLGAGLQTLLPNSAALRAALGLSDYDLQNAPGKLSKRTRHFQNNAASKARTVARNKNRDKRSAALVM